MKNQVLVGMLLSLVLSGVSLGEGELPSTKISPEAQGQIPAQGQSLANNIRQSRLSDAPFLERVNNLQLQAKNHFRPIDSPIDRLRALQLTVHINNAKSFQAAGVAHLVVRELDFAQVLLQLPPLDKPLGYAYSE